MLQRVIRKMLLALGEHDAIDLGVRIFARECHVLIDFRQPTTECADGPLQLPSRFDEGLLMGKMPDAGAPVLQVDVPQFGTWTDDEFNRAEHVIQILADRPAPRRRFR